MSGTIYCSWYRRAGVAPKGFPGRCPLERQRNPPPSLPQLRGVGTTAVRGRTASTDNLVEPNSGCPDDTLMSFVEPNLAESPTFNVSTGSFRSSRMLIRLEATPHLARRTGSVTGLVPSCHPFVVTRYSSHSSHLIPHEDSQRLIGVIHCSVCVVIHSAIAFLSCQWRCQGFLGILDWSLCEATQGCGQSQSC